MTVKLKNKKVILIILAVVVILGLIYVRNAWRLENAKYGLNISAKEVYGAEGVLLEVECSGIEDADLLTIDNQCEYWLEKWTPLGWKSVEYKDPNLSLLDFDIYHLDEPGTHEIVFGWRFRYGEVKNGTYKIKLPIFENHRNIVGYCYGVFKVSN